MIVPPEIFHLRELCDVESTRYTLGGLLFERDANGNPWAVATDGVSLLAATWTEDKPGDFPAIGLNSLPVNGWSALIPAKVAADAQKLPPKRSFKPILTRVLIEETDQPPEKVRLGATDLETSRILETRVLDGHFPRWREVLPHYRSWATTPENTTGPGIVHRQVDVTDDTAALIGLDCARIVTLFRVLTKFPPLGELPTSTCISPLSGDKPFLIHYQSTVAVLYGVIFPIVPEDGLPWPDFSFAAGAP